MPETFKGRNVIRGPRHSKVVISEDGKAIDVSATEDYEKTCPKCAMTTRFHSIDGGLTSIFKCSNNKCGIEWVVSPFDDKRILERRLK